MSMLDKISTKKEPEAFKVLIYGPPKIGKSTFAANIPNHIFMNLEGRLARIPEANAGPRISTYDGQDSVKTFLQELIASDHKFTTLVVDSVDYLEDLMSSYIARSAQKDSIESIPYGQGYGILMEEWKSILEAFEILRIQRNMHIVLLCHAMIKTNSPATGGTYDYYAPKLYGGKDKFKGSSDLLKGYCDVIGFANNEDVVKTVDNGFSKKSQAVNSSRKLFMDPANPAYEAGLSFKGMPTECDFTWLAFSTAVANALAKKGE